MSMTGATPEPEAIKRLTKDLANAAKTLDVREARYLVDAYYTMQDYRIASAAQVREMEKSKESNDVLDWAFKQYETMENQIKRALDNWTDANYMGRWAKSICGIGPVISAGLLAHIDIKKAPTAGHIWRFAGLDPTMVWLGKEKAEKLVKEICGTDKVVTSAALIDVANLAHYKPENLRAMAGGETGVVHRKDLVKALSKRPYNAQLKTLCAFKMGESFVKVQNNEKDVYGKLFAQRKREHEASNDRLEYKDEAARILASKKINHDTDAYKALIQGRLPQAQIHARARRYAVKIFLSHYQAEAYRKHFNKEPPAPFPIAHLGHVHVIQAPPSVD